MINPEDLRIDVYRLADFGRQCAVRVTHMPSGFVVTRDVPEDDPSQLQARDSAIKIIADWLAEG